MKGLVSIVLLALWVTTASAQESDGASVKKEAARFERQGINVYDNVMNSRGPFAKLHDMIGHHEYDLAKAARDEVVAAKATVDKLVAAGKASEGEAKLSAIKDASDALEDSIAVYKKSSDAAFEKFMIYGGLAALIIAGLVGLGVVNVRKKRQRAGVAR